jgi:hypothetical protein
MIFEFLSNFFLVSYTNDVLEFTNDSDIILVVDITTQYDRITFNNKIQILKSNNFDNNSTFIDSIAYGYVQQNKDIYVLYDDINILKMFLIGFLKKTAHASSYLDDLDDILRMNLSRISN